MTSMTWKIAFLICLGHALAFSHVKNQASGTSETPVVTTPLGQIKGSILTSRLGKRIYSFRGIRYAKPPVDELRFKPPVSVEKWDDVYDATDDRPTCPRITTDPVSEDCLFVNVYSTKLPKGAENPKRPVIIHILPGAFYSVGSASYLAGPNYFMDQDIVLVTFNYRLATLGFLSTGTKDAPGNNGLKDQVEVLKWVKRNIASFGGDPDSVTIHGYSAGAWSVILHMVSPMSKGLFHKAAAMSGSPLGNWPIPRYNQLDVAKKQAKLVDCPDDTVENIINCLKTKPSSELVDSLPKFAEFGNDPILIWSPVIEQDFGQERFLTDHPISLIVNGDFHKVPLITGVTKDEFGYLALDIINNETLTKEFNAKFENFAPISFLYERDTENSKTISRGLKTFYLHDKRIDQSQSTSLAKLYEDSLVGFTVNRAAKLIAQYSDAPVYYYRFSYQGRYSHIYLPGSNNTIPYGVVHHDDLIYLFYISRFFPLFKENSPVEVEMVSKLTSLYANFAKTGNPIPTPTDELDKVNWEPFTTKDQKYLDIGTKLILRERLYEGRYTEWEKLFPLSQYTSP